MRYPITIYSRPELHLLPQQNLADWKFVAAASAQQQPFDDGMLARLDALKNLREELETQGVMCKIWSTWGGSSRLALNG